MLVAAYHDGGIPFFLGKEDGLAYYVGALGIDAGGGFIQEQAVRLQGKAGRQGDALAFSSRKFVPLPFTERGGQADQFQCRFYLCCKVIGCFSQFQAKGNIVKDRPLQKIRGLQQKGNTIADMVIKGLCRMATKGNRPAGAGIDKGEQPEHGGLAAAVGTDQSGYRASPGWRTRGYPARCGHYSGG